MGTQGTYTATSHVTSSTCPHCLRGEKLWARPWKGMSGEKAPRHRERARKAQTSSAGGGGSLQPEEGLAALGCLTELRALMPAPEFVPYS